MSEKRLKIIIGVTFTLLILLGGFAWFYLLDNSKSAAGSLKDADKLFITYKYDEAIEIYEANYDKMTVPQKINMSDAYYKIGDSVRASYILDEMFEKGQVSIDYYTMFYLKCAGREVLLKKTDIALEYYKKALEFADKSSYEDQVKKEYAFFISDYPYIDELPKAIEYWEHMVENTEQKHNFEAYYKLGNLYYESNEANRALLNWNKALSYNKKHIQSMEKIAMLYLTVEEYEEAFKMNEKILKLENNNWQAHLGIGEYHFIKKNYREAKRHYESALYQNKENDYLRLQIAKTHLELDSNTSAYDYLTQIVERNKSENMVKEAKELLKDLGKHGFVPI